MNTDGTLLSWTNWASPDPNDGEGGSDCSIYICGMNSGNLDLIWRDRRCNQLYAFVCESTTFSNLDLDFFIDNTTFSKNCQYIDLQKECTISVACIPD